MGEADKYFSPQAGQQNYQQPQQQGYPPQYGQQSYQQPYQQQQPGYNQGYNPNASGYPPPPGPQQQQGQNGYAQEFGGEKQSFDQTFKIAKPKWNDLWAGILVRDAPVSPSNAL